LLDEINPPALHGEAVAGRAARVREKLKDLTNDVKSSTFDLADLLFEAQENNYPRQWGFASTVEYGQEELGLKKRKTQYLTRITKVCRQVGLKRERYEPSGITKLREITTLDPEKSFFNKTTHANEDMAEHIVRLILDSDKMTVEQIEEEVLRLKGRLGADRPVHRTTTYPKSVWDNVIKPARELARQLLGSSGRDDEGNAKEYSDGACDEVIAAAFLANPNNIADPGEGVPTEGTQAPTTLPMEF
jgi:hypothetical protein